MNAQHWKALDWLCRIAVAVVMFAAGFPKLLDSQAFLEAIGNYQLIPDAALPLLAVVVPPIEIVAGAALVTGIGKRGAALVSFAMLGVFAIAISQAVLRGINIDCGCFGSAAAAQASWWSVLRNLGLMAASAVILIAPDDRVDGVAEESSK